MLCYYGGAYLRFYFIIFIVIILGLKCLFYDMIYVYRIPLPLASTFLDSNDKSNLLAF